MIVGGNESGKSSWHAATFAALCGRRRAKGRPSVDEQQFIDAHQPWSGESWAVSCRLRLDDGREIELRQDLSGKVDCRATDVLLARDVSSEIMVDGSPDASAWLGLTRTAFRATACVGQAEVLRVLDAAEGLQQSLQRVTSTAGASGTAAAAIGRLDAFRRESVGRESAASVKPLRRALDAVAQAQQRLATVDALRQEFAEFAQQQAQFEADVDAAGSAAERAASDVSSAAAALRAAELQGCAGGTGCRITSWQPSPRRSAGGARRSVCWWPQSWWGPSRWVCWLRWPRRCRCGKRQASLGGCPRSARLRIRPRWQSFGSSWPSAEALARPRRQRPSRGRPASGPCRGGAGRADARACRARAEVEEALAAAERELARVRELDETLGHAIHFLRRAQERVHREVVPELTGFVTGVAARPDRRAVRRRPDGSGDAGGRRCAVPRAEFRRAELLSHGTAEQIYLLLRVALAARLTAGHDTCPLLLDDVTVHADPERTRRMLDLLHRLSGERQIVLFAHQDQVREWAYARFDGERDALDRAAAFGGGCLGGRLRGSRAASRKARGVRRRR